MKQIFQKDGKWFWTNFNFSPSKPYDTKEEAQGDLIFYLNEELSNLSRIIISYNSTEFIPSSLHLTRTEQMNFFNCPNCGKSIERDDEKNIYKCKTCNWREDWI